MLLPIVMKKIVLTGFVILISQFGYSQQKYKQSTIITEPKNTAMLGLRTVIYKVGDINDAKKWYAKAFQAEPYFDQPFYVGFNIGGYELGLHPEETPTADKPESVVTYWGVSKIEKEYSRLIELGAIENEKPSNVGGDIMTATVKDPWGNIIGLIYNPEFKLE